MECSKAISAAFWTKSVISINSRTLVNIEEALPRHDLDLTTCCFFRLSWFLWEETNRAGGLFKYAPCRPQCPDGLANHWMSTEANSCFKCARRQQEIKRIRGLQLQLPTFMRCKSDFKRLVYRLELAAETITSILSSGSLNAKYCGPCVRVVSKDTVIHVWIKRAHQISSVTFQP
jgi:hypothetical protein